MGGDIFSSLASAFGAFVQPLLSIAGAVGPFVGMVIFFIGTWKMFTLYGDKYHKRDKSPAGYFMMMFAGAAMMSADSMLGMVSGTLGMEGTREIVGGQLQVSAGAALGPMASAVKFAIGIVIVVGAVGFFSGLYEFSKIGSGGQQGGVGGASTKMIAGAMAINVEQLAQMVGGAFGGKIGAAISLVLGS